jgi:hypothetical protein
MIGTADSLMLKQYDCYSRQFNDKAILLVEQKL